MEMRVIRMLSVKRAIISVSDKNGIVDFAKELSALGVEIISEEDFVKQYLS